MTPVSDTHPQEENQLQVLSLIGIIIILVFYSDITTPLGLMTWILYFIPLFLTLYLRWQYGAFIVGGSAILLIGVSFFISPRDMSETYAIINRVFFAGMLALSALMIEQYKKREKILHISEERYQNMIEWSPDAVIILKDQEIQYINPSGLELCRRTGKVPEMNSCLELFEPADRERITTTINQAIEGARVELIDIRIVHGNSGTLNADLWIGEILWDDTRAIQMIIRTRI
ncbi:MAG TPA: PAS domain-containing protein [Methanospirillum sp.]|nr:PAS domain-containing protein [Methanospirillum sp.]